MDKDQSAQSVKLGDSITDHDYTILRSTKRQDEGIEYACYKLEKALGIDKSIIREVFREVYTELQVEEQRFHFETENDLPQAKLASKKLMEPRLKSKLYLKLSEGKSKQQIDLAVDKLFEWYMNTYLKEIQD